MRQRAADGGIAAADTDVNGLMRANRTAGQGGRKGRKFLASCVLNSCLLGETYTVRYSGRVCQYVALRGVIFYATWVVPQELISCPILVGQEFFIFIGYTKLKTLLNLNTPLQADTCGTS